MVSRFSSPILRELSGSSVDKTGSSVHLNTAASDPPSLGYSILEEVYEWRETVGLGLVKTERIRIIGILIHRLTLIIHMRSPTMFTIRLIKDQLIALTSLMRTPIAGTTKILLWKTR
nr:hypothetical protein [Tanacetum cinerariifolium]